MEPKVGITQGHSWIKPQKNVVRLNIPQQKYGGIWGVCKEYKAL